MEKTGLRISPQVFKQQMLCKKKEYKETLPEVSIYLHWKYVFKLHPESRTRFDKRIRLQDTFWEHTGNTVGKETWYSSSLLVIELH